MPTASANLPTLSRRERQIMDLLFRQTGLTALQIQEGLSDPPSYSAVRALLRVLEDKGHVRHEEQGPRYIYMPVLNRRKASTSAVRHLVETFFRGSVSDTVAALLDSSGRKLNEEEFARIEAIIDNARKEGR